MLRTVAAGTGSLMPPSMRMCSPIRNGEKIQGAEKLARMASLRLPSASSTLAPVPTSVAIARNGVSRSAKVEPLMGPSDSSTRWKCSPAKSPGRLTLKSTAR
jgi:hypothetical protein